MKVRTLSRIKRGTKTRAIKKSSRVERRDATLSDFMDVVDLAMPEE
jgi:hypothetical protein